MSERQIKVTTLNAAWPGRFIAEPDSDEYPVGTIVPADHYLADEQDWQRVKERTGHADIGTLVLEYYNGEAHVVRNQQWNATCWLLVDADGDPVVQDEPNGPV